MPRRTNRIYDGGWFTLKWTTDSTEYDSKGCDGLYLSNLKIRWWNPKVWLMILIALFRV